MKTPGRPSKDTEDWPALVEMAERWRAGKSENSVRKISRITVGIEAPINAPIDAPSPSLKLRRNTSVNRDTTAQSESVAKRLERKFKNLDRAGEALPISVHRVYEQERKLALKRRKKPGGADEEALRITAARCQRSEDEVQTLNEQGRKILIDRLNDARQNSQ